MIDSTYFNNNLCLILYRDNTIKFNYLYRITDGEWYKELQEDLENLLELGIQIKSINCDRHKPQLKAICLVCKHVPLQCCVVDVQRMCQLRCSPKINYNSNYKMTLEFLGLPKKSPPLIRKQRHKRIHILLQLRIHRKMIQTACPAKECALLVHNFHIAGVAAGDQDAWFNTAVAGGA